MSSPDPGWYPDPEDEARLRYWDGEAWTDRTSSRSVAASEAVPPPPPDQPPAAAPGSEPAESKRRWLPITAAGALLVVVAVVAFVVFAGGSDEAGAEVILQPTASSGEDPFTDSIAGKAVKGLAGTELAGNPISGVTGADRSIESISGSAPGLYGGTEQEAVCDPAALVAFLKKNPDKASAFAGALGIKASEIPDYVAALTPVLLREDTRVTNNGFSAEVATPFQAVLEAGTAVLVDERGVPRVRCACGNPLAEPAPAPEEPNYSGESWDGFDSDRLVAVSPADREIESFELVDVNSGERFEQAAGGGGAGDVRDLVFDFGGVGDLRLGMTAAEATKATGLNVQFPTSGYTCEGLTIEGLEGKLSGFAIDGSTIGFLIAYGDDTASTTTGVEVGSDESEIESAYPNSKIRRETAPFGPPGAETIYVESGDAEEDTLRFGTDEANTVQNIGVGRPPDLGAPEGCE